MSRKALGTLSNNSLLNPIAIDEEHEESSDEDPIPIRKRSRRQVSIQTSPQSSSPAYSQAPDAKRLRLRQLQPISKPTSFDPLTATSQVHYSEVGLQSSASPSAQPWACSQCHQVHGPLGTSCSYCGHARENVSPVTGSAPLGDGAYTVRHESSHLQRPILEPGPTPRFIVNTRASASAGYLVAVRPRTDPCITRNDQRVPAETIRPIDARPVTAVISVKRTTESKKKGGHKDATDARLQDIIGAFLSQHSLAHGDCACTPEQHYISLHGSSDEDLTKMGHPSIKSLLKLTQDCGTRTGRLVVAFEREDGLTVNPVGLCKLIQMWDAQSSVSFFVFNPNHATTSYEVDAMAVLDMMKSLRRGDDVDRSTKAFHFIRVIINISVDQANLALAYMDNLAINETARNTSPIDPDDASSDTLPSRSRTPVVQLERNCEGRLPCPLDGCCADTFDTLTKLTRHLVELCEDSGSCVLCSRMGRVGKTVAYYKEHIRTHLRIKAQDSSSVNVVQVAGYKSIDFFAELTDCVLCKATLEPSEIFDHHQKDCKRLSKVSREAFHSVACPICGKTMGVQSMYSHVEGHRRIEEIHRFAKALGVEQGNLALHF